MATQAVDFTLSPSYDIAFKSFNKVYEFSSGSLYIVTYKGNEELMQQINSYFELNTIKNNTLKTLYNHYFNDYTKQAEFYFI